MFKSHTIFPFKGMYNDGKTFSMGKIQHLTTNMGISHVKTHSRFLQLTLEV